MKKLLLALAFALAATPALAQNPTCPDRPNGDSSNACANTRFVMNNGGGGGGSIPYANITGLPSNTILGNNTGGVANALALTPAQTAAMLPDCSGAAKGLVPTPTGSTTNFLRADCTYAPPGLAGALYAADYGVVCDGVTDTSAAMQTAANAAAGYKMILPRGTCIAVGITWPPGSNIVGQGGPAPCNTTIKRPNFTNGAVFITNSSNVSDLCIDGNWAGNNVTATTNLGTGTGFQTLSFASVPPTVTVGMWVRNLSTEPTQSILHGTTVAAVGPTTVLLSIPVQAPGVSNGDVIQFRTSPSAEMITGGNSPLARSIISNVKFINGNWIQLYNCGAASGACPSGYTTVINSIFDGQGVANAGSAWGIYSNENTSDLEVVNTTVYGYALNGIACNGRTRITNSLFYGNASETPGGQVVCGGSFQISNNTFSNSGFYGSGVEVVGQGAITGNQFINQSGQGAVYMGTTAFAPDNPTTVVGNTFQGNYIGVIIPATNGAIVTGNHFYTSTNAAIVLQGTADYNVVSSNVCQFNTLGIANSASGLNNYIPSPGNPGC